jgi:hypothetical protein
MTAFSVLPGHGKPFNHLSHTWGVGAHVGKKLAIGPIHSANVIPSNPFFERKST